MHRHNLVPEIPRLIASNVISRRKHRLCKRAALILAQTFPQHGNGTTAGNAVVIARQTCTCTKDRRANDGCCGMRITCGTCRAFAYFPRQRVPRSPLTNHGELSVILLNYSPSVNYRNETRAHARKAAFFALVYTLSSSLVSVPLHETLRVFAKTSRRSRSPARQRHRARKRARCRREKNGETETDKSIRAPKRIPEARASKKQSRREARRGALRHDSEHFQLNKTAKVPARARVSNAIDAVLCAPEEIIPYP